MVILITGASHTGKTLLAQRLLEKLHYSCLSIDHLKMGLIRSGNTTLTPEDDDALTDYLWPILREMVKTAAENRQDLILEGCYIPPDWRKDFSAPYLASIRFICLAFTDAYIDQNFGEILRHASDIESRLDDSGVSPEGLKADNRSYRRRFGERGEAVTLIDSDYEGTLSAMLTDFLRDLRVE
ncbi:MAG: AAA family ATPase [Oscillospiraceae bacterium]|nr:AAA family ATPase [Oscillospiraceae bacterium]